MDSLGNKFQAARESQGLTLEEMVSRTRIQESYLNALEEDEFEQLPERVFTKGFVRAYARSLNLDEEECLQLFTDCSASFYKKQGESLKNLSLLKEDGHQERTNRTMVVLLVGGLILLGAVVIFFQQHSPSTAIISRFSQQPVEPRDEGVPETGQPGQSNEVAEDRPPASTGLPVDDEGSAPFLPSPDPAPIPSATAAPEENPLVLQLRTLEPTWTVVRSDENEPHEALLRPGEIVQWRARERFLLTLGNAGGVEVRLNGELRGPFGEAGAVVRDVELTP